MIASSPLKNNYILMKTIVLTLAIALIGLTSGYAQTAGKQNMTAEQKAEKSTAKLEKTLQLTADQKQKIYAVELDKYKQSEAWHQQSNADRKAKKDQHIASKKETDAKIDQVLTADQKKKLEDLRTAKKAKMQERKDNHKGSKPDDKVQE
jgi:protein CpxP